MFKEWGFLLGEIWFLLLLAALLGLFAGWLIWGRRSNQVNINDYNALKQKYADLEKRLNECHTNNTRLKAEVDACEERCLTLKNEAQSPAAFVSEATPTIERSRPKSLSAPNAGKADDLKQIKGIGVKLEKLCHRLGFYHFDQIAEWTDQEIAWVDENLEGFKGRVTRDEWVRQAKILARGGETEFSKRVEDGEVDY